MTGHIPRLREEGILRDFLSDGAKYRLCWIIGEKKSGKTEIVKSVAGERDDTLYYVIEQEDDDIKGRTPDKAKEYRYIILDNTGAEIFDVCSMPSGLPDGHMPLPGRRRTVSHHTHG